jgi:hypothetical protein
MTAMTLKPKQSSKLVRLQAVPEMLPVQISKAGVYRWATKGVCVNRRVVRLQTAVVGGLIYTSVKWINEFNQRIVKLHKAGGGRSLRRTA